MLFSVVHAQQQKKPAEPVQLKGLSLQPSANAAGFLDSLSQVSLSYPLQVLLQFNTLPSDDQKALLETKGFHLLSYIPANAYIALIDPAFNAVGITSLLYSITPVQSKWKASDFFWKQLAQNSNVPAVEFMVSFYKNIDAAQVRNYITASGARLLHTDMEQLGAYKASLDPHRVSAFASWYGVEYLSPVSRNELLDKESKAAQNAHIANMPTALGGYGLLGDGVVIGVGDNIGASYHVDLKDRVIDHNPNKLTNHGIHINGIIGGAGIVDNRAEGMAPHVRLIDHLYDNVLAYTGVSFADYEMSITNNSYAVIVGDTGYSGLYDNYAVMVDNLALQYKNVTHVFAAGNDGLLNRPPYPAGFATVTGGYQPAKNAIVVTSTSKRYVNATDGSRGPVDDGRLKPELTANGVDVFSTIRLNDYLTAGGTSMASPQVAGSAVLLTQRYKQSHANTIPRSDVLKAILVNGATDIGNPGPDYRFGFGFLNLYRSLQILDSNRYYTNTIATAGLQSNTINVPAGTAQLKVILYWHDPAASPLSAKQLINDLDLTVQEPSATIHKPLVLDPAAANILNNAVEGDDHLNNIEQVTINNPATGAYSIKVSGFNLPSGNVDYVVAYDFVPTGIKLTYPATQSTAAANDSLRIYWEASNDVDNFTLQYSTDNGNNWNVIDNNIPADQRFYSWMVPNISSELCKIQLIRNVSGQVSTSGTFVINPQTIIQLDSIQCPGYINMHWNAVTNATAYEIIRKKGREMQAIDTIAGLSYSLSGLSFDSTYYVAVRPLINGKAGYRSTAIIRKPNDGTCVGSFSDGDLAITEIVSPASGRMLTSTQLTTTTAIKVRLRNLDDAPCNNYKISYKLNSQPWASAAGPFTLLPLTDTVVILPATLDLSTVGIYALQLAVTNLSLADPGAANDTAKEQLAQLLNNPVDLTNPFIDGFETMGTITLLRPMMGISPDQHWDYDNTSADTARLRTSINDSLVITGAHSVSMDANLNVLTGAQNYLTGTFNLAAYNAATAELRLDFDYLLAGKPKFTDGNQVWIRGNDVSPWLPVFSIDTSAVPGTVYSSGTLSLSDVLLANGQGLSTSTQLRFGQHDTSLIALRNYGNGLTIDNLRLYVLLHDVQLLNIITPQNAVCGLGNNSPLTIQVYNSVNAAQNNVQVNYRLDNGTIVTDNISSIAAKDTILYTFPQLLNLSALGTHVLDVWLSSPGDGYMANDSILHYTLHNQPLITSFPYLQDFEQDNGYWYTEGINDTWGYGTPAATKINKAASGTKAWKTNLNGQYKNLETSYLYSPCLDISSLLHPMLSFSLAADIENCGTTLCDAAYMEYSYDGISWSKLGAAEQGTNWYDPAFNVWNKQDDTRWHVASTDLPLSTQPIRLRFVFKSDQGASREGIAVDDIHVFDKTYPIYEGTTSNVITQTVSGTALYNFTQSSQLLAQLNANNQNLGDVDARMFTHDRITNDDAVQYLFPRNYTISAANPPTEDVSLRLYILDSEFVSIYTDNTCPSCSKPTDAYSLGITKYDDVMQGNENGFLEDNINGTYTYTPASKVKWVPYDKGYYAQFNTNSFSEFWFNDGGPTHSFDVAMPYLTFDAHKITADLVKTNWTSRIDTSVLQYELQRSVNKDSLYQTIRSFSTLHQPVQDYMYMDTPGVPSSGVWYYRLKYAMQTGGTYYSPVRRIDWIAEHDVTVFPNPTSDGTVYVKWAADAGTQMQVAITDIMGRLVYTKSITATDYNNISAISPGRLQTGIYFLKVITGDVKKTFKIAFTQ